MTILQILYVLEIAKHGNLSKAAECLYVSQPALSLQIKRLEQELGCELFHRKPQGVILTDAGSFFCKNAQKVADTWSQLQDSIKLLDNAMCKKVRIGIGPRALSSGMFDLTASFFDHHPEIEVTYLTDIGDHVIAALEAKRMDLAIDRLPPKGIGPKQDNIAAYELLQEQQCILLSPQDPRASRSELPFSSLGGSALVSGPEGSLDDLVMKQACQTYGVQMARVQRADNLEAVMALIRSGKGIALGPASFARQYHVAAVPMLPHTVVSLYLLCLKSSEQNPLIRQLRDQLVKGVKKLN